VSSETAAPDDGEAQPATRARRAEPITKRTAKNGSVTYEFRVDVAKAFGIPWSNNRLIAVREDGSPIRHEWYSDEFQHLRERAGLRRIHLKGLRNTSVSLMLAGGLPVHVVAAWHGHDPAVSLSIYSDAQREDLRTAGATLFG
jgi:site-specific recombinase XerD